MAITGHVTSIYDPQLGLTMGQAVTGTYSYDTASSGSNGVYSLVSPPSKITLSLTGGPTYQTQPNWSFQIMVESNQGQAAFGYQAVSPPVPGSSSLIEIGIADPSNTWLNPPSLPTTVPPLSNLNIYGSITVLPPGSRGFYLQIDTATLVPSITVSPANSSFIAQQNFDAVLLLSAQLSVASMQASVNGTNVGFSYPGTCQLAAANNAQRTALICPNAAAVLAGLGGGPVTINWLVTFADGSTAQPSVIWNLVL